MPNRWVALIACLVLVVGPTTTRAQETEATEASTPARDPRAACYRQSDLNPRRWERLDWEERSCFYESSCNGGLGIGSGLCLKWARGPNALALPWSAAVVGDEPPGNPLPTDEGLPLEYGLFAVHQRCAENSDACPVTRWRANERVPIYAEPDQTSRRVARLNRNETVLLLEHARFFAAQRGVAAIEYEGLIPGDVVYAYEEVCKWRTVWRRGDLVGGVDEGYVNWEPPQRLHSRSAGYWVRLERANGQSGWARAGVLVRYLTPERPPEPAPEEEYDGHSCE